jgi:formate dehydrogenase iron-sulfur subunit
MSTGAPGTEIAIHRAGEERMGFSPTRPCASVARPARSRASSGTTCPPTARRSGRGVSYDYTGELSASTWRHVRFVALLEPSPQLREEAQRGLANAGGGHLPAIPGRRRRHCGGGAVPSRRHRCRRARAQYGRLGVHVRCPQALHQRRVSGCLPHRRADPHGAPDGVSAAGRLQRLRILRPGVPVRGARSRPHRRPRGQVHAVLRPARGRTGARPREVLPDRFDPVRTVRGALEIASRRVAELHRRGVATAYLYGAGDDPDEQLAGGLGRSSC